MTLANIQEIAHGSPDLGVPIKIGGKASSSAPDPVAEGSRVDAWFDLNGRLNIAGTLTVDSEFPAAALLADNTAVPTTTLVGAILMGYDGTNIDFVRKDSNGALLVNPGALVYTSDSVTTTPNQTTVGHGHKEVTTAGTDVVLAGSTPCKRVTIQAYLANTGKIAVGGSGVDASATIGTGTGALLSAGESISFDIANLDAIYIDSTINGEGVRYIYQN